VLSLHYQSRAVDGRYDSVDFEAYVLNGEDVCFAEECFREAERCGSAVMLVAICEGI